MFGFDANIGAPQVAYRETFSVPRRTRGRPAAPGSSRIKVRFTLVPAGFGVVFVNSVGGGTVPKEFLPGVKKGLRSASENGVIAAFNFIT
jgi:elongation factor G